MYIKSGFIIKRLNYSVNDYFYNLIYHDNSQSFISYIFKNNVKVSYPTFGVEDKDFTLCTDIFKELKGLK